MRSSLAFPDTLLKILFGKDTLPLTMFSFVRSWESTRNGELPVRLWESESTCMWLGGNVCVCGRVGSVCWQGDSVMWAWYDTVWVGVKLTGCKGQLLATTCLFPWRLTGPTRPLELQKDNKNYWCTMKSVINIIYKMYDSSIVRTSSG